MSTIEELEKKARQVMAARDALEKDVAETYRRVQGKTAEPAPLPLPPPPTGETNPKKAFGDRKLPVHLVPPALRLGAAKALAEGAGRYGAYNWRKNPVDNMTYIGAIGRHLDAYLDGEDVDPESTTGKLHLEGIAACVAILLDSLYAGTLVDARPPAGPAPGLTRDPGKAVGK